MRMNTMALDELEQRVAELEKWLNEYCDIGGLGERVAELESLQDDTRTCYKDCFRRLARLERYVVDLEEYTGVPSPIPWGDLD